MFTSQNQNHDLYADEVLLSALGSLEQTPWDPRAHVTLGSAFQHRRWTQGPGVSYGMECASYPQEIPSPQWLISYAEWAKNHRQRCPNRVLRGWLNLVAKTTENKADCYFSIVKETVMIEGPQQAASALLDTHGCSLAAAAQCAQLAPAVRAVPSGEKKTGTPHRTSLQEKMDFVAEHLFGKLRPLTPSHKKWLAANHLESKQIPRDWWRHICYVHVPPLALPHALVTLDGKLLIYSGHADPDELQCAHELGHLWEELLRFWAGPDQLAAYLLLPAGRLEATALSWEWRMATVMGRSDEFWYWNFDVSAQLLRYELNLVQEIIAVLTAGSSPEKKARLAQKLAHPGLTRSPLASAAYCTAAQELRNALKGT